MSKQSQFPANPAQLSASIQSLLPPCAVAAELRGEGDPRLLLPAEAEHLARAVPKRAREFAAGRLCARRALAEFGIMDFALRAAQDRRPLWPEDYVGSITHTAGLCAAAVARRRDLLAIGLDTEILGAPTADLFSTICVDSELSWLESQPEGLRPAAITLVFCAKEAFYKCQYPLTGEWLDFHDLRVEPEVWGEQCGTFKVFPRRTLLVDRKAPPPSGGRYLIHEAFVSCAVAFPAAA